jgi:hypothetical protein
LFRYQRLFLGRRSQGCQTVYFHTKNPNFGKFWKALDCKFFGIFQSHPVHTYLLFRFGIF